MEPSHAIPGNIERIILIGFMGAGKSTVGSILAKRLSWDFVDSDQLLESEAGASIATLFSTLGEPVFRKMEAQAIAKLCTATATVIALGGGAIETASTRSLLHSLPDTCVVFLQAPLEILIDRCEQQPNAAVRPVLRQRELLRQRFQARLPHYESAHVTLNTEGLDAHSVADRLLKIIEDSIAIPLDQKAITT